MNKEVIKQFSINDIELFRKDDDVDFVQVKLFALAEGSNSHGNPIDFSVLERDADTILGKFIIAKFSKYENGGLGDVTTHVPDQQIMGYVLPNQEVQFEEKDGKRFITADGVISKLYATDVVKALKNGIDSRSVSCEFSCLEGEENENGEVPILAFQIHGITILGLSYKPSCAGAELKVMKFAEEFSQETSLKAFAEKRKNKLNKKSKTDSIKEFVENKEEEMADTKEFAVEIGNLWGLIYGCLETKYPDVDYGSIYRIYGIYEEGSQKFAVIYRKDESNKYRLDFSISESGIEMGEDIVEVKENFEEIGEVKRFSEDGDEKFKMFKEQENIVMEEKEDEPEEDEDKDEPKEEEKEMGCHGEMAEETKTFSLDAYVDSGAILAFLEKETEQYKELANKVLKEMSAESIVMQFVEMTKELAEFKEEKAKAEKDKTDKKLFSIMTPAKESLSVDMFVKLYEEGKALSFSELDAFNNKVKAFVDENKVVVEDKDEIMTFGSNDNNIKEQENIDVFEKLSRKYN